MCGRRSWEASAPKATRQRQRQAPGLRSEDSLEAAARGGLLAMVMTLPLT